MKQSVDYERFSKILVAIDGSEPSMDAAKYAIEMARKDNASLIVLHVVTSEMGYADISGDISSSSIREISGMVKQESQQWFDKIKLKTDQLKIDLKTDVVLSKTNATHTIVDYADSEQVDLIVIGTRGKSGFKKLLVGSIASGVVTYASCPVMVVK
ncbi:MAG TPA: universal stress protein [Nitrososphaeraceae archaeon]|jgi:nucleotide-binding universal stress UspA family protein|nr:universal stress protein [Nitrososphaeraceae archaeon]